MHKKCSIVNVIAGLCSKHGFEPSVGSVAFSLSVSECLSWLPMAIVGDLSPPQWIPPSPIFSFIAGIKERRDSQRLWALLSYQILFMTPGKEAQSALFAWFRSTIFREMQGFPMENILISFRELCQKWYCWCVFCASVHTHIYREFCEPRGGTAMHKNKALFPQGALLL